MKGESLIEQSVRFTNGEIGAIVAPTHLNEMDFKMLRRTVDILEQIMEYDKQEKARQSIEGETLYIED